MSPETGPSPLLVARAQLGDRGALDLVLRALQEPLHAFVLVMLRDEALARDVLQNVLWMICRRLGALRDPRWVRAWAYRIAAREAIRMAKRERRQEILTWHDAPDTVIEEVQDDVRGEDLLSTLPSLIAKLPPASAVVLRLHYLEGLTHREISEALEIPLGTVKSRLSAGLTALRRSESGRARGA